MSQWRLRSSIHVTYFDLITTDKIGPSSATQVHSKKLILSKKRKMTFYTTRENLLHDLVEGLINVHFAC